MPAPDRNNLDVMKANKKMSLNDELSSRETKLIRILDEAAKTLNRKGLSQSSLAELAKRLGISRSALYYYFEDQEDLVFQCYRRACEQLSIQLNEARQYHSETLMVIEMFIKNVLGEHQPELAVLSEPAFLRDNQQKIIFKLYDSLRSSLADIIDEGINKNELRSCHSGLVASAIIGIISWIPKSRRSSTHPIPTTDLINFMLKDGIAADRTSSIQYSPFTLHSMSVPAWQSYDQEVMARARQEAFLAAASWLFNMKGVDATSLDEIAQRVGVTKKLIYHNIGDKQKLVALCYQRSINFYDDIATRVLAYKGYRIDALTASVHALAEASIRCDIAPFRPFTGVESQPQAVNKKLRESSRHLTSTYSETYNQGVAEGSLRDMPEVLSLLPAIAEWLPKWLDSFSDADRTKAPREMAELFRIGLRAL